MLVVGLTGGMGTGKSTFAALLAEHGAQVIDADELGHDALKPGQPAWHSVVDQFGEMVLVPHSMEIDRKRLASIVFADRSKLAALNVILHPVIFAGIADHLECLKGTDEIVVLDAALILETGLVDSLDILVVVVSDRMARNERLIRDRGMTISDIRSRIASQAGEEELVSKADILVENNGSLDDLAAEAERVWKELQAR